MVISFPEDVKSPLDYYKYMEKKKKLFFRRFLQKYKKERKLSFQKYDLSQSYYWPPLHTKSHAWIDWT